MNKKIEQEEIDFLKNSNWIEEEPSPEALEDAIEAWVYARDEVRNMNEKAILGIHERLMKRLNPRIAGRFRNVDVMVGGRTCPNFNNVNKFLTMWVNTFEGIKTADDIKDAHIEFEYIHPFEDGNGRTGRIIYNWQRVRAGLPIHVILEIEKQKYYSWFN